MAAPGRAADARRRLAGLVWGVVSGPTLTAEDRALLADGLGGVVLFARNVVSPEQLRELTGVATYHEGPHVAAALARALRVGPSAFPGRLPVHLDLAADQEIAS